MLSLTDRIAQHSAKLPEGAPLCPNGLLHLGSRAAVDQALSRLARRGRLMRWNEREVGVQRYLNSQAAKAESDDSAHQRTLHLCGPVIQWSRSQGQYNWTVEKGTADERRTNTRTCVLLSKSGVVLWRLDQESCSLL